KLSAITIPHIAQNVTKVNHVLPFSLTTPPSTPREPDLDSQAAFQVAVFRLNLRKVVPFKQLAITFVAVHAGQTAKELPETRKMPLQQIPYWDALEFREGFTRETQCHKEQRLEIFQLKLPRCASSSLHVSSLAACMSANARRILTSRMKVVVII